MKNRVVQISLIMVLAILMQVAPVSAQVRTEPGLVGSWDLQVTLRNCNTGAVEGNFAAINTYNQGGTMHQAAVLPNPGVIPSGGHGAWSNSTGGRFSAAFRFFGFNLAGVHTDKVTIRSIITLEPGGDTYTSVDTGEIAIVNGPVFIACSTSTATRFR